MLNYREGTPIILESEGRSKFKKTFNLVNYREGKTLFLNLLNYREGKNIILESDGRSKFKSNIFEFAGKGTRSKRCSPNLKH
jgi:hypothetical protein